MVPRGAHLHHNLAGKGYEDTEPWLLSPSLVSTSAYSYKTNELVVYVCAYVLFTQSCPVLCDLMDYSPTGSAVHGILQARILEWVDISSPGDLLDPGIEPASLMSSALADGFFTTCATWTWDHLHDLLNVRVESEAGIHPDGKLSGEPMYDLPCFSEIWNLINQIKQTEYRPSPEAFACSKWHCQLLPCRPVQTTKTKQITLMLDIGHLTACHVHTLLEHFTVPRTCHISWFSRRNNCKWRPRNPVGSNASCSSNSHCSLCHVGGCVEEAPVQGLYFQTPLNSGKTLRCKTADMCHFFAQMFRKQVCLYHTSYLPTVGWRSIPNVTLETTRPGPSPEVPEGWQAEILPTKQTVYITSTGLWQELERNSTSLERNVFLWFKGLLQLLALPYLIQSACHEHNRNFKLNLFPRWSLSCVYNLRGTDLIL